MKAARILATAALLAPIAAAAQASYAQPLTEPTLTRSELRECMYRDEAMAERRDALEGEQARSDAEAAAIAAAGARLADELRNLDHGDVGSVAAYNARSAAHNQRVQDHNRHVAALNARAARLNGDSARLDTLCARPFYPSDRDSVLMERSTIR